MNTSLQIKTLTRDDILTHLDALADILENCVRGGASVSFMLPFSTDKARAFWQDIAGSVERNERVVLACIDSQDGVIGTVQLITDQPETSRIVPMWQSCWCMKKRVVKVPRWR
ncbi:N-acetyltransferase GCN5 [Enterobacter cloacae]|uniref:N-acetyltransferase GCN5 n=1 Tax=Enterobacter cloacae TaxID=550 RepID=A0A377LZP0_ENTCL|nr:N-acetyltransferase GCN5 [Enterobacter cloacae]